MRDKMLLTALTALFFTGAMISLHFGNDKLFVFSSGLCLTAFGAVVALVRGDKNIIP
jgi:hypothetical protein